MKANCPRTFFLSALLRNFFPVSGPTEQWCASTLGTALLCNSRAGSDLGLVFRLVWGLCQLGSSSQVGTRCGPWRGNSIYYYVWSPIRPSLRWLWPSIIRPLERRNLNFREKSIAHIWIRTRVRCVQSASHTNVPDHPALSKNLITKNTALFLAFTNYGFVAL